MHKRKNLNRIVVIATRNIKKRKEIEKLLGRRFNILTVNDISKCPNVEEDGKTFRANAVKKAKQVSHFTDYLTVADDSGLEVFSLNRAPGVKSARFAGSSQNDSKNIEKLLKALKNKKNRNARFVCSIAIAMNGKVLNTIQEYVYGHIGLVEAGRHGFGYDPVFIPNGYTKTFASLGEKIKNRISHRSKALKKTKKFLSDFFK